MSNRRFRATLLKEDAPYQLDQTLADTFSTLDVSFGPSNADDDLPEVAGIVEDCWYNGGIIAEVEIFDDDIAERISDGLLSICPTVARECGDIERVKGINIFVTPHPDEEVVGEVEEV